MDKRTFLKSGLLLGTGVFIAPAAYSKDIFNSPVTGQKTNEFEQIPLKYDFNALEPHIDAKTLEVHYSKHHASYTSKFNASLKEENLGGKSIKEIFGNVSKYSASIRNNGGGHFNHNFFWQALSPNRGEPKGDLLKAINTDFGSFDNFKKEFSTKAATVFGSGWAWLIKQDNKLKIVQTSNQDNPLMDISKEKGTPLLTIDVWEHAYYLKYQNRRPEYIESFWNVVNWDFVSSNLKS